MNIGVFAVDPGGSTGVAWGIFDPNPPIEEVLKERMLAGSATISGDVRQQIREIATLWQAFYRSCVRSALLPPDHVWFVCEDYIYTVGNTYGGEPAAISTSLIWGIEGYRMGRADEWREHKRGTLVMPTMVLQTAGQAKGFATNTRLKEWDVWVVGREHERSAWQHVAYFLAKYKEQYVR